MTLQDYLADVTPEAAKSLGITIERMPSGHKYWHTEETAVAVAEQLIECLTLNETVERALRKRASPEFLRQFGGGEEYGDIPSSIAKLLKGAERLAEQFAQFPSDYLDKPVEMPWAGETPRTFAWLLGLPYWSMTYHLGQLNYFQTAYGDLQTVDLSLRSPE